MCDCRQSHLADQVFMNRQKKRGQVWSLLPDSPLCLQPLVCVFPLSLCPEFFCAGGDGRRQQAFGLDLTLDAAQSSTLQSDGSSYSVLSGRTSLVHLALLKWYCPGFVGLTAVYDDHDYVWAELSLVLLVFAFICSFYPFLAILYGWLAAVLVALFRQRPSYIRRCGRYRCLCQQRP